MFNLSIIQSIIKQFFFQFVLITSIFSLFLAQIIFAKINTFSQENPGQSQIGQLAASKELQIFIHQVKTIERNKSQICQDYKRIKNGKITWNSNEQKECGYHDSLGIDEMYVLLDLTIKNVSEKSKYIGDIKFELQADNNSFKKDESFVFLEIKGNMYELLQNSTIPSGDKIRGKILFKVKENTKESNSLLKIEDFKNNFDIKLGKAVDFPGESKNLESQFETPKNSTILKFGQNSQVTIEQKNYKTGKTLDYKFLVETLDCVDRSEQKGINHNYNYSQKPKKDSKFVMCRIRITNQNDFVKSINPNLLLKNKQGLAYQDSSSQSQFSLSDDILPNQKIMSESYFEVPENFVEYRLYLTFGSYDSEKLIIFE